MTVSIKIRKVILQCSGMHVACMAAQRRKRMESDTLKSSRYDMRASLRAFLFGSADRLLATVLWLVALHSVTVGILLIIQPLLLMQLAGLGAGGFFPAQGGIFHLLMAVAYATGAININKYRYLIIFSIFVKAVATFFLLVYCLAVEFKWIILLSGMGDGVLGAMIFAAFQYHLHFQKKQART